MLTMVKIIWNHLGQAADQNVLDIRPQENRRLTVEILCRVDKPVDMGILTYNHWTNYKPARLHA
jgi:hypothetical protein